MLIGKGRPTNSNKVLEAVDKLNLRFEEGRCYIEVTYVMDTALLNPIKCMWLFWGLTKTAVANHSPHPLPVLVAHLPAKNGFHVLKCLGKYQKKSI